VNLKNQKVILQNQKINLRNLKVILQKHKMSLQKQKMRNMPNNASEVFEFHVGETCLCQDACPHQDTSPRQNAHLQQDDRAPGTHVPLAGKGAGEFVGQRFDKALAALSGLSRTLVQNLIHDGLARVNGQTVSPKYLLKYRDHIYLEIPETQCPDIIPENIPLHIVYEDDFLLVVNKPQGMLVHPAFGIYRGTLVNALLYQYRELSGIAGPLRPGIVHRIDKDTSGLLLVARNDTAHTCLTGQLNAYSVERVYRAIVHGAVLDDDVTIDAPIGRDPRDRRKRAVAAQASITAQMRVHINKPRRAVTHIKVLQRFQNFTEVRVTLETGRIHQIRVHLAWMGHPVAGDPFYGPNPSFRNLKGQMLHSEKLGFVHPETMQPMCFEVEPPILYQEVRNLL
jgi:23S rRNA pseudouridine1911/1915/1917 synthase